MRAVSFLLRYPAALLPLAGVCVCVRSLCAVARASNNRSAKHQRLQKGMNLSIAFGQLFIYKLLTDFDPLTCALTTTTRKLRRLACPRRRCVAHCTTPPRLPKVLLHSRVGRRVRHAGVADAVARRVLRVHWPAVSGAAGCWCEPPLLGADVVAVQEFYAKKFLGHKKHE